MRCSCSIRASTPDAVVRQANAQLDDHQKIRRALVWPEPELPRTEGTRKLKRAAIRDWVKTGGGAAAAAAGSDRLAALIAKYAGRTDVARNDDARRAGLELARSRRADGRARGRVSDAHRRRRVLRSTRISASCGRSSQRSSTNGAAPRRAGRLSRLEPIVAGAGDPPRQPADVDSAARTRVRVAASRGPRAPAGRSTGR